MPGRAIFDLGPPDPVLDSRQLPVITFDDEQGFVTGADLGEAHPDNVDPPADLPVELDTPQGDDPGPLPSEDELDSLVAQVDVNDVDQRGFDAADTDDAESAGALDG
jgi:hypothetical protein